MARHFTIVLATIHNLAALLGVRAETLHRSNLRLQRRFRICRSPQCALGHRTTRGLDVASASGLRGTEHAFRRNYGLRQEIGTLPVDPRRNRSLLQYRTIMVL